MRFVKACAFYLVVNGCLCTVGAQLVNNSRKTSEMSVETYNLSLAINKVIEEYDAKVRPNAGGDPVMVDIEFKVISFGELDEVNMAYTLDIFVRQWWYDPSFTNDYSIPYTMAEDPRDMFWVPDTYFVNVKESRFHYVTRENMRVLIYPDGKIYFSARISLVVHCDMDFRLYPMDTQYCKLTIESYAYTQKDVDYNWRGKEGIEIVSDRMAQFNLASVATYKKDSTNSKGSFASLRAGFAFQRRIEFHISFVYVPGVVLVILSWFSYFISPAVVPARTTLCITTILASILLQANANKAVPKVSYMKALDFFLLPSFGFIFAAMIEFVVVLNTDPDYLKPEPFRYFIEKRETEYEGVPEIWDEDENAKNEFEIKNKDKVKNEGGIENGAGKLKVDENDGEVNVDENDEENTAELDKVYGDSSGNHETDRADEEDEKIEVSLEDKENDVTGNGETSDSQVNDEQHGKCNIENRVVVDSDRDNEDGEDSATAEHQGETGNESEGKEKDAEDTVNTKAEEDCLEEVGLLPIEEPEPERKTVKDVVIGILTEGVYIVTETQGSLASGFFKMTVTETTIPLEYGEKCPERKELIETPEIDNEHEPEIDNEQEPEIKPEKEPEPETKKQDEKTKNRIHWLDGAARILLPMTYSTFLLIYLIYYSNLRS